MRRCVSLIARMLCAVAAVCAILPPARGEEELAMPVAKGQARGDAGNKAQAAGAPAQAGESRQMPDGAGHVELERLGQKKKARAGGKAGNAFGATSWYHRPPPPAPTAPPLPFTYLGRYQDAQKLVVMLASGPKLYTVSQGDVIDGIYRVDAIGEGTVELMYLPLNIAQPLSTAGAQDNGQPRPGAEWPSRRR